MSDASVIIIESRYVLCKVALNPGYQLPEIDYSIQKVGVKAMIAPESFRKQKYYEMLTNIRSKKSDENSLEHIIIHSDKKLP